MPGVSGFFSGIRDSVGKPSSTSNLQSNRINLGTEVLTDTLNDFNPMLMIPGKIAQTALSFKNLFTVDSHLHEKLLHGGQAALCAFQVGLSTYMFLSGYEHCNDLESMLCRMLALSQLFYRGLLLTNWVSSEVTAPEGMSAFRPKTA